MRTAISSVLALLLAGGCTAGSLSGGGGDDDGAGGGAGGGGGGGQASPDAAPPQPDAEPPATYAMGIEPTLADLQLNQATEFTISLSSDRFAGPVVLSAAGHPESWEIEFAPSSTVSLEADGTAEVTMTVRVPSDGEAAEALIAVAAAAAPGAQSLDVALNVANELVLPITPGTGGGLHTFPPSIAVRLGATVTFENLDAERHRIHSSVDADGFPHEPSPGMDQGQTFAVTPTVPGGYDYYCHEHDAGSGTGILQVIDPSAD